MLQTSIVPNSVKWTHVVGSANGNLIIWIKLHQRHSRVSISSRQMDAGRWINNNKTFNVLDWRNEVWVLVWYPILSLNEMNLLTAQWTLLLSLSSLGSLKVIALVLVFPPNFRMKKKLLAVNKWILSYSRNQSTLSKLTWRLSSVSFKKKINL